MRAGGEGSGARTIGFIVAGAVGLLILAFFAAAAAFVVMKQQASDAYDLAPVPAMPETEVRTAVVMSVLVDSKKDGKVVYSIAGKDFEGAAALAAALKAEVVGARLDNDEVFLHFEVFDAGNLTREDLRAVESACRTLGVPTEGKLPKPLFEWHSAGAIVAVRTSTWGPGITIAWTENGKYDIGGRKAGDEAVLGEILKSYLASHDVAGTDFVIELKRSPGMSDAKVAAARAACKAAGVDLLVIGTGKSVNLEVKVTGVRNGVMHFTADGEKCAGTAALTAAMRRKMAALVKERGGAVVANPSVGFGPGVDLNRKQRDEVEKAVRDAIPVMCYMSFEGRKRVVRRKPAEAPLKEITK